MAMGELTIRQGGNAHSCRLYKGGYGILDGLHCDGLKKAFISYDHQFQVKEDFIVERIDFYTTTSKVPIKTGTVIWSRHLYKLRNSH